METKVLEEELTYPSADGEHTIHAKVWMAEDPECVFAPVADAVEEASEVAKAGEAREIEQTDCEETAPEAAFQYPRAIIQLVHGMAEHIDRYRDFAEYLVRQGFVVCAENHLGHGTSVNSEDELGHVSLAAGKAAYLADMHHLRNVVQERYSDVPYIMFGHSMGSFMTRSYVAHHGEGLSAAIMCGTGHQPYLLSAAGNVLAKLMCRIQGEKRRNAFIDSLGAGGFAKSIPNARTAVDWISTDNRVVDAYIADPACGQMFSVSAYAMLTDLTKEIVTSVHAVQVPTRLPLLFIAGAEDPVGEKGKAVKKAVALYKKAGVSQVDLKLYDGMRHEILNEPDHLRVYEDVVRWISDCLKNTTN